MIEGMPVSDRSPIRIDGQQPSTQAVPLESSTWDLIQRAIVERLEAVECFLADVAGRFRFLSAVEGAGHIVSAISAARAQLTASIPCFRRRVWLASMDLTCDSTGQFWFVDDHYCCPFGLRMLYELAGNSSAGQRATAAFTQAARADINEYAAGPLSAVVLGSDTFSTAYREHRFFADWLSVPFRNQRFLEMRPNGLFDLTSDTKRRVDLVIRRLQDDDLDPNCFRAESLQGVRGIVRGAQQGSVSVINSPGTGLFNSRILSSLIPRMIRFYLAKDPELPTIPTVSVLDCNGSDSFPARSDDWVFRTANSMDVLKPLVPGRSSDAERNQYFRRMESAPEGFVVRKTLAATAGRNVEAVFGLRTYCVGTARRSVFRGGISRACHQDGTPMGSVTQDRSLQAVLVTENRTAAVADN